MKLERTYFRGGYKIYVPPVDLHAAERVLNGQPDRMLGRTFKFMNQPDVPPMRVISYDSMHVKLHPADGRAAQFTANEMRWSEFERMLDVLEEC